MLGGVLACLKGCSSAWRRCSSAWLGACKHAFLDEYKSEINVGNSSLLRYSDLGAK